MDETKQPMIDGLEQRVLMAAAPRVVDVFADNRGTAWIKVDQPLRANTVNSRSVQILVKNRARPATVTYDAAKKRIRISTDKNLKKDSSYVLQLKSRFLKGADGKKLDGEFKGDNKASGNGKAGGDFIAKAAVNKKTKVSRMETVFGDIDIKLFTKETPKTAANFMAYADAGQWDGIFFDQLGPPDTFNRFLFAGRHYAKANDELGMVVERAPIANEARPGRPGNVFGTIGSYRDVDGDAATVETATNNFFFNLSDNRGNLDNYDGGLTVFGKVINKSSSDLLKKLAKLETVDAGSNLNHLPVRDKAKVQANNDLVKPHEDLVTIHRISIEMSLVAPRPAKPARASRQATELRSDATMLPVKAEASSQASVLDHTDDVLA